MKAFKLWSLLILAALCLATLPALAQAPSGVTAALDLLPASQSGSACEGTQKGYALSLTNNTGSAGTFTLTYTSLWTISGPASLTVNNGQTVQFNVFVTVPCGSPNDTATITASGNSNTASATVTTSAAADGWIAALAQPQNGHSDNVAVGWNGFIWDVTGYGSNANVRKYDPRTNAWTTVGTGPTFGINRARSGCKYLNNYQFKVFFYGDAVTTNFTGLWEYRLDADVFTKKTPSGTAPAQTGIYMPALVTDEETGYCYITGGATASGGGTLTTVYRYNPATNAWLSALPSFTSARNMHAAFIFVRPSDSHKLLCVVGGDSGGTALTSTQCYDFVNAAWNAENADLGALPATWKSMGYSPLNQAGLNWQLWIGGGTRAGVASNALTYYDVAAGAWIAAGNSPGAARLRSTLARLDNELYVVGGSINGTNWTGLTDRKVDCIGCPMPMFVGSIRMTVGGTVKASIAVDRYLSERVPGATVDTQWTLPDGSTMTASGTAGVRGIAQIFVPRTQVGTYQICVTNVTASGYAYSPAYNKATCATVTAP